MAGLNNRIEKLAKEARKLVKVIPRHIYAALDGDSETVTLDDGRVMTLLDFHAWWHEQEDDSIELDSDYPLLPFFINQELDVLMTVIPKSTDWDNYDLCSDPIDNIQEVMWSDDDTSTASPPADYLHNLV